MDRRQPREEANPETEDSRRLPPIRLSVNNSPARKTELVQSPFSPAMSQSGVLVPESPHTANARTTTNKDGNTSDNIQSLSSYGAPRPTSQHLQQSNDTLDTQLLPEERSPHTYAERGLDFFDTDSSDIELDQRRDKKRGSKKSSERDRTGGAAAMEEENGRKRPNSPNASPNTLSDTETKSSSSIKREFKPTDLDLSPISQKQAREVADFSAQSGYSPCLVPELGRSEPEKSEREKTPTSASNVRRSPETWVTRNSDERPHLTFSSLPLRQSMDLSQTRLLNQRSSKAERILNAHALTLQAILRDEADTSPNSKKTSHSPPHDLDSYSTHPAYRSIDQSQLSPSRPYRPTSGVESFITSPSPQTAKRDSRPLSILKPPPAPPTSEDHPVFRNDRMNSTNNQSPSERPGKRVSVLTPPPVRLPADSSFMPPEFYTPYPFSHPLRERNAEETGDSRPTSSSSQKSELPKSASKQATKPHNHSNTSSRKFRKHQHSVHKSPISSTTAGSELQIPLFVRRRKAPNRQRKAQIHIPMNHPSSQVDDSTFANSNEHFEKRFISMDFDDCRLSEDLRKQYHSSLLGDSWFSRSWRRFASARSLQRIRLVLNDARLSTGKAGPFVGGEIPEKELMHLFKNPKSGRNNYSWVRWAQAIARSEKDVIYHTPVMDPTPPFFDSGKSNESHVQETELEDGEKTHFKLEFVEGWRISLIITVISLLMVLSLTACLIWIFLGPALGSIGDNSASRVAGGVLLGILVLFLGSCGIATWIGVSWLVM